MEIKEAIRSVLKELILPEIESIKSDHQELKAYLDLTNKRLDDVNLHLADFNRRIDETNKRIDSVRDELLKKIDETNNRISETNKRIDNIYSELINHIDSVRDDLLTISGKIDHRLDRLYEVIVRREEHEKLELRVMRLENEVQKLKEKIAA